jgi:SNF2 family DNA or RNA helicase
MINAELYINSGRPIVILERRAGADPGAWARMHEAFSRGIVGGSPVRIDVRADVFLAEVEVLREVRTLYGQQIKFGITLEGQLRNLAADRRVRESSLSQAVGNLTALSVELKSIGFRRELKEFQLSNLANILRLPHGADFSVPGAGKTTVALANFALNRARGTVQKLLVIGPIAAFGAWKEDAKECFSVVPSIFTHSGTECVIPKSTDILLTNYNRLAADYDRIRAFVAGQPVQVILDEAHRIKRGGLGVHGRAVLDLAFAAKRRDILTGTPAPQGAYDLIALVSFLYPGQDQRILPQSAYVERDGRDEKVLTETQHALMRYFVRTTKSSLGLKSPTFRVERQKMGPIQHAIYEALVGKYRGAFSLPDSGRREFDRLGRISMYLLEAATNPLLLPAGSDQGDEYEFLHPPLDLDGNENLVELLRSYHVHETPWKYSRLREIIESEAAHGRKVIVWSNFVRNLKALNRFLSEYQPALVHGGVPSGEDLGIGVITREMEIRRFRSDSKCSVLLANPAACGEGISLHHECHHAIYLDRTFNAGQFLQSQDRIHRLGLKDGIETRFTILESENSIDESVDSRLEEKVRALATLMNDPGLVQVALPEPDEGRVGPAVFLDDISAIRAHILGRHVHAS